MKLIICDNKDAWAKVSADMIRLEIIDRDHPVLILPTGSTPEPIYASLIKAYHDKKVSFAKVTTFNLDEYVGLPPTHDQSYRYFMQKQLFDHVDIVPENTHVPLGYNVDAAEQCNVYEAMLAQAGGADLAMVGVGRNGHIGFNEPGTSFESRTHIQKLSDRTRLDNSRFFASIDDVPTQAITMGMGTILSARKILFIATGAEKAEITYRAFTGPVTEEVPASLLQRHNDVTVILDRPAARKFIEEHSRIAWKLQEVSTQGA